MQVFFRSVLSALAVCVLAAASGCATSPPREVTNWRVDFPIVSGEGAGSRWVSIAMTVTERADGTGTANMQLSSITADPCWAGTTNVTVSRDPGYLVVTQPGKMASCRTIQYRLPLTAGAPGAVFVRPGLAPTAPFVPEPSIRVDRQT
jgi:hypothetical protein